MVSTGTERNPTWTLQYAQRRLCCQQKRSLRLSRRKWQGILERLTRIARGNVNLEKSRDAGNCTTTTRQSFVRNSGRDWGVVYLWGMVSQRHCTTGSLCDSFPSNNPNTCPFFAISINRNGTERLNDIHILDTVRFTFMTFSSGSNFIGPNRYLYYSGNFYVDMSSHWRCLASSTSWYDAYCPEGATIFVWRKRNK